MSALWIGNFSFEDQLSGRQTLSRMVQRFEAELAPCLVAAAAPDDFILCPQTVDPEYPEYLRQMGMNPAEFLTPDLLRQRVSEISQIKPWGWSESVRRFIPHGITVPVPELSAVRAANSREVSYELSQQLGCALDGEERIQSLTALQKALQGELFENGYVLKSNYGQAGRSQIMSSTPQILAEQTRWVEKRLTSEHCLYLEPRLRKLVEWGIQWDLPPLGSPQGTPQLYGITRLLCDEKGKYLGSRVSSRHDLSLELELILSIQKQALVAIQQLGYFGPVGIDAMIFETFSGARAIRPLQDINARWTMGRLAIAWGQHSFAGRSNVCWVQGEQPSTPEAIRTSPLCVGGQPVLHQTWCTI